MKILYYNLQLGSFDGSNMHAVGMLNALKRICGEDNVYIANDFTNIKYNHKFNALKKKLSIILKPIRILRRKLISKKSADNIINKISNSNFKPDYILARSVLYDTTPLLLAKKLGCKLIIEQNTPFVYECCHLKKIDTEKSVRKFESKILEDSDGIYVVSDVLKDMLLSEYSNIDNNKIIAIPNGYIRDLYSISDIDKLNTRNRIRKENGTGDKWVVVFVGSLQSWHGIDKLLVTAQRMENIKDVEFWILGDGEKRDSVEEYTKRHNNLKWFGNVPFERLRDLLLSSDLGIMPYENIEKFYFSPLKMFDMIGAKLPFIGLKTGQIKDICESDFSNDFLLETSSSDEIITKIETIRSNSDCYKSMKLLLETKSENYSWDVRAKTLVDWMSKI